DLRSSSARSHRLRRVDERESTLSRGASIMPAQDSRSLSMPTADRGGSNRGRTEPSFQFERIQRGASKLIWDGSMLHCWLIRVIVHLRPWMYRQRKAVLSCW